MATITTQEPARRPGLATAVVDRLTRWETPVTSYYLLLGSTLLLVAIGLVMVLSSSSVESYARSGSSFAVFGRQALFAAIGLPLMWGASRLRVETWKRLAWPLLGLAVAGQLLVLTPLGVGVKGNTNWIEIAGVRAQPSEAAKLALAVWCAAVLARKRHLLSRWAHVLVPVGPFAGLVIGLVLTGRDLGTALVMMAVVAGALFVAGVPTRMFLAAGGVAAVAAAFLVSSSRNRMSRVQTWLSAECTDTWGACWQTMHGKWALASGGWWGVGLGASREKWEWLPEAHNDFIYAIIGEELGLPGTLVVVLLFTAVGVACARVVRRADDVFVKIATAGVLAWVVGQAMINIAVVLGLLPVIGIPLPLVSAGGSALVSTLLALGMVLSFARAEPGARDALEARSSVVRRSLAVVPLRVPAPRRRPRGQGGGAR
ncbi:MAG: putative lipid II flippase FtsW [Actinomycetes bacterium]